MKIGINASLNSKGGHGRYGDKMYLKLKSQGYDTIDFNMANTNSPFYTLELKEAENIFLKQKELAKNAGIIINQVHGPWRYPPKDTTKEDLEERMEKMKKSIYFTSLMGCKNWVIHPIMPCGVEDILTSDTQKTWDMNMEFMTELLKTAKKYGVTICLENMPFKNFSLSKPCDTLRFVKAINDDNFKICLDTGHVSIFKDLDLAEETRRLSDEIRVLHVHDNENGYDLHIMPYLGINNWEEFGKALIDIGYDGSFSLETCAPQEKLPDDIFEDFNKILVKVCHSISD